MKTDEDGAARGPITTDGEWMFLVRHVDFTKKVDEEFDETVFFNTLVMVIDCDPSMNLAMSLEVTVSDI